MGELRFDVMLRTDRRLETTLSGFRTTQTHSFLLPSGAVLPMQSFPGDVCGLRIRDVLLPDLALRGPELAPREEQDVQEGVHQEHQGRCRRRSGSRTGGRPLWKPLRQHLSPRPYSGRGATSGPGQATICAWLPRAFSLNPPP